eukprot:TRINITY_DN29724_c0_g1_i2.p2 TRINITY_DN29724_c0_g1~~TRINITY_DN29724_c0_g1_i2.p2  ORF type:complete len:215 (+),score=35.27 TRINITY_DN29724_c0_g1_i2:35-646(+)
MASATAAELEIFAGKLAECLRSAAAAAASSGAGGDVAGGSDTDSLQLEALRLQADAVHAKRLFDNLPSRDQDASLQRRIEDVSDGIHELAARCHPDSEWEISDDDGSTPPAQPTQPPQPAQPGVPPPQQASPAQQSTPHRSRSLPTQRRRGRRGSGSVRRGCVRCPASRSASRLVRVTWEMRWVRATGLLVRMRRLWRQRRAR